MKRMNRWVFVAGGAALLAFSVAAEGPSVAASTSRGGDDEQNQRCSVRTLNGTYAVEQSGWVGSGAGRMPYSEVGYVRLDGRGRLNGATTFSLDGAVGSRDIVGTYTVDSDTCTGEAVTSVGTFHFVLADNGKQTRFIATTTGTTLNGSGIKQ
jgi:hypothetical protein